MHCTSAVCNLATEWKRVNKSRFMRCPNNRRKYESYDSTTKIRIIVYGTNPPLRTVRTRHCYSAVTNRCVIFS
ncbi:unnamed protein product [Dicrocoelium dendriticum]|nr:unnamed protein product [Dicrocoelium dendriticum]